MIIVNGKRRDGGRGKRPSAYDFSGLGTDTFSETLEDGTVTDYSVERDNENRITKIMSDGLHDVDIVWEREPPDPWPTKPYLYLTNGQRIKVMEGTYDPAGPSYDPGGMVKITAGTETALLYPDTQSPGASLTYALQNGARIVYTADDAFRAYDKNGNLLALDQPLPDYPNAWNLSLFYAYAGDTLIMGFWYSSPTYLRVDQKAASGVPGQGTVLRADTYYGLTDYYLGMLHDFAIGLLGGGT